MPRLGWWRRLRASGQAERSTCQGCLELITPTQLVGWAFHPEIDLREVRLLRGSELIASAPIDGERADVAAHLGRSGRFGFQLEIPDSRPDVAPGEPLRLLALSADGSERFPIALAGAAAPSTAERLGTALASEFRGLRGHFDGLSPDGSELIGWCYSHALGPATVWLHAEGLPPRALRCTIHRPGMAVQGHREECGFVMPLHDWPEARGRQVWASFDAAGALRLPPMQAVRLPAADPGTAPALVSAPLTTVTPVLPPNLPEDLPAEYQAHWQALEEFRELIDSLELQVRQAEELAYSEALPPSRPAAPLRRRSALFRLWR